MTPPILAQTYVRFPEAITLNLTLPPVRISTSLSDPDPRDVCLAFAELPMHLQIDALARTITAYLPPIHTGLLLYSPADFSAACADSMDDHAARVLHLLGTDPATALQALIDGPATDPETGEPIIPILPPRIPREISNWRAKAQLHIMGHLDQVEALIDTLHEPRRTIARLAWSSDVKLARTSPTVADIATALRWSSAATDAFFIDADALVL